MVEALAAGGAALGVGVQCFVNSIQKVPLTRYPYMHLALGLAGAYALPWYDNQVSKARERVTEKQREKMETHERF
jgi:hypothetical protein